MELSKGGRPAPSTNDWVICLLRYAVLKLGGAQMLKEKLYPFAMGVLRGSVAAQAVILALNTWFDYYQPGTPGIPVTY